MLSYHVGSNDMSLVIWYCLLSSKLAELINSLRLQAMMFNDENNYFDVLVASDAIGMGLNLNISRIIFSKLRKYDGTGVRDLTVSEIKQIAGKPFRRHLYCISLRLKLPGKFLRKVTALTRIFPSK